MHKIAVSPSSLNAWLTCKLQYYYLQTRGERATLNVDILRGIVGHAAMESFYGTSPEHRTLDLLLVNAQQALRETVIEYGRTFGELAPWDEENSEKAWEQVNRALRSYWATFKQDTVTPTLDVEVRLSRELPNGHEFHGVADAVERRPDRVIIWEFKFPYSTPYVDSYLYWSPQHRYYGWMLDTELPVYVRYNLLTPGRVYRPDDFLILPSTMEEAAGVAARSATEISACVEPNDYTPNYAFHCGRCAFKDECLARLTGATV